LIFNLSLILDLSLVIVFVYCLISGAQRGTQRCVFSLVALCSAYPIACYVFPLFASLFPQKVGERILTDTVAFTTLLISFYFLVFFLLWAMLAALKRFRKDISEEVAGGILGLLKGVVVLVIALLLVIAFLPGTSPFVKNSLLARSTLSLVNSITKPFPSLLKQKFIKNKQDLELGWKGKDEGE
jgi:membrane protein required for colicin V production